ncbi:MAG: hypothetical protein EON54_05455 [Alcaligenaceae bacterium]|nr:MAG: hypothetical protein EON54_05455 [Alcaligenaceae bacterium]
MLTAMPLRVVLDSNIYTGDKLRKGEPFKTLARMCKKGDVLVILPYIVEREIQTQLAAGSKDDVIAFLKSGKELLSRGVPDDVGAVLGAAINLLNDRQNDVVAHAQVLFDQWGIENNVAKHGLSADLSRKAMEAYFTGQAPLTSPKDRKHIPDAFLYQAIVELAGEGPLFVVSQDNQLRNQCANIPDVEVFENLTSFIASAPVQGLIVEEDVLQSIVQVGSWMEAEMVAPVPSNAEKVEKATVDVKTILERLRQYANSDPFIKNYVAEHGAEDGAGQTFRSRSVPGDDGEAYLQSYGPLDEVELYWDDAAYMGDSTYLVPYRGTGEMLVEYYLRKSDWHEVDGRKVSFTDHNDYVFEVEEERGVTVDGLLRIELDDDAISSDDISTSIQSIEIDSIENVALEKDA